MTGTDEIGRLEARLERERRARRQAEQIAERGMRELWETNRELQLRIDARTGQLERELASLAIVHRSTMAEVASTLEGIVARADGGATVDSFVGRLRWLAGGTLVTPARDDLEPVPATPIAIADDVVDRWQRIAARSGQLLSVEADDDDPELTLGWDRVVAALDLVLASVSRHGPGGAVSVRFTVDAGAGTDPQLLIQIRHSGITGPEAAADRSDDRDAFERLGAVGLGLAMAAGLAENTDGALDASIGAAGLAVALRFPSC